MSKQHLSTDKDFMSENCCR